MKASDQDAYDQLRYYTISRNDPMFIHQHVVDAFAAQNADSTTKPITLTFSLIGLYRLMEHQYSGRQVHRVHAERRPHRLFHRLQAGPLDRPTKWGAAQVAVSQRRSTAAIRATIASIEAANATVRQGCRPLR